MTPSFAGVLNIKRTPSPYVTSIALGLVACLIVAGSICAAEIEAHRSFRMPHPDIVYVAADATTEELACKVYNAGDIEARIVAFYVNATSVSPRVPLPVTIRGRAYATVVLPYNGPWNGSIQITLYRRFWGGIYVNHSQEVDLDVASTNPMSGAYPTPFELLPDLLLQHALQIGIAIVVALLVTVVTVTLILRKRGRVSLLVFVDEVLAFFIYFVVFWEIANLGPFIPTLVSSVLSVLTIYVLLPPPPRTSSASPPSEYATRLIELTPPPPSPKSVYNRMQVGCLFGVDGQGGEIYTEFSTVFIGEDRTVVQAVLDSVVISRLQLASSCIFMGQTTWRQRHKQLRSLYVPSEDRWSPQLSRLHLCIRRGLSSVEVS
jgi:hypothetical protein